MRFFFESLIEEDYIAYFELDGDKYVMCIGEQEYKSDGHRMKVVPIWINEKGLKDQSKLIINPTKSDFAWWKGNQRVYEDESDFKDVVFGDSDISFYLQFSNKTLTAFPSRLYPLAFDDSHKLGRVKICFELF